MASDAGGLHEHLDDLLGGWLRPDPELVDALEGRKSVWQDHGRSRRSCFDHAMRFGKEPTAWLRTIDTVEYLSALAEALFGKGVAETDLEKLRSMESRGKEATHMGGRGVWNGIGDWTVFPAKGVGQ